jgi:hypothetical protein
MLLQQQTWLAAALLKCPNQNEQQGAAAVPECTQYAVTQWQGGHGIMCSGKGKRRAGALQPAGD